MTMERAPQLLFDDGSRIIQEQMSCSGAGGSSSTPPAREAISARGSIPLTKYYEIDRIVSEVIRIVLSKKQQQPPQQNNGGGNNNDNDDWFAQVALQFPDELLCDSPEVCWAMEEALSKQLAIEIQKQEEEKKKEEASTTTTTHLQSQPHSSQSFLVFCLGDTTFGPCCPDEVAALHLQADVLVHYGHACLSHPPLSLPVVYGFGICDYWDTETCVDTILQQCKTDGEVITTRRLLLLYQVKYQHAMEDVQTQLSERGDIFLVMGQIQQHQPEEVQEGNSDGASPPASSSSSCCRGSNNEGCSNNNAVVEQPQQPKEGQERAEEKEVENTATTTDKTENNTPQEEIIPTHNTLLLGGLEVPKTLDFSTFTLVFIGDDDNDNDQQQQQEQRQYMNTVLWYLSTKNQPAAFWTYSPKTKSLDATSNNIPRGISRQLNRRFYLIQKARDATVFGILIGTLSQKYFRSVVANCRNLIENSGGSSYTFAMGKVNPAKIANFAEIECFVLVACAETTWLGDDTRGEMHVPIITPLELFMAIGGHTDGEGPEVQWGQCDYSLDYKDFLTKYQEKVGSTKKQQANNNDDNEEEDDDDDDEEDDDAPYFSMITGKYESSKKKRNDDRQSATAEGGLDLKALPGKGQLTTYKSEAAEFLKNREYKGLETQLGETEVHVAVPGQQGIASKYNNDLTS